MKKLLIATALALATCPAVAQFRAAPTHSMPPESMTCGIVSQTKDDAKPTDTIYSIVLNVEGKYPEITSFDATHVAVDGKTYTRSDQYEGALAWDKKTFVLVWQGQNKKNPNLKMYARLKPYNDKLWSYEETLTIRGKTTYKMLSICHVREVE